MSGIKIRYWTAVSLAAGVGVFAASSEAATRVDNLHLKRAGKFVELSIPVPSHLLCEHFTLPATGTKSFRIVLDFCDALHRLPRQNFGNLPASVIKGVRTSQFANDPQPIVRIVLDLTEAATYSVRSEGQVVTIAVADPQGAFFSAWEANPSRPNMILPVLAENSSPAGNVTTQIGSTPKRPAQTSTPLQPVAQPTETPSTSKTRSHFAWSDRDPQEKRTASSKNASTGKTVKKPASEYASKAPAATQKSAVSGAVESRKREPMVTAMVVAETKTSPSVSKTEPIHRAPEHVEVASVAPSDKPAKDKTSPSVSKTVPTYTAPKTENVTVASAVPNGNPKESVSSDTKSESAISWAHSPVTVVEAMKPRKPFTLPDHPLVLAPDYLETAQMAAQKTTRVLEGERSYPEAGETAPFDPAGPMTGEEAFVSPENSPLWASVDQSTVVQQASVEAIPVAEVSLIDRLKTKFFGNQRSPRPYATGADLVDETDRNAFGPPSPGGGGKLDRAALLERIRVAEQEAARRLQHGPGFRRGAPPRTEITYDDSGRRDPFDPLLGGLRSGFVTNVLPSVENLRMVGVLHDDYDALALLEDMEGHSYILRSGDPVENGVVLDVRETRVIFEVDDYGWIRTVALQLSSRGADPKKALGFSSATGESDSDSDADEGE